MSFAYKRKKKDVKEKDFKQLMCSRNFQKLERQKSFKLKHVQHN